MEAEPIVREIERDRRRPATALAERALDALSLSRGAAPRLLGARPSMPLIAAAVRLALRKGIAAARRELRSRASRVAARARAMLPPGGRYLVFGASSTVEAVLRAVGARRVRRAPCDVALVGADALLPGGDFVNARGTAAFLRRARRARAGVFAVATDLKRVGADLPLERGFERVDGWLVHGIITESGLHYPPSSAVAGPEPSWLDRGPLGEVRSGACHPHH
jgi:translation initiation factor 2B subunit (eIF-2B alpha/beta/delta family)